MRNQLTQKQLEYMSKKLTASETLELTLELFQRKKDQLDMCLHELSDVDELKPAKVTWHGIDLYELTPHIDDAMKEQLMALLAGAEKN